MSKPAKSVPIRAESINLRHVVSSTCRTLSRLGALKYSICVDSAGTPYLGIVSNEGGGLFSHELVAWTKIKSALDKSNPITSTALHCVFARKSANTPGFLLAVLVKEKLVEALPDKTRHFKLLDPAPFLDRVAKLAKSSKPAAAKPGKKLPTEKTPPKKKAKK